ncbi:hypothetical protein [Longimicrobium sp.]|uniref:hypothetical protein n=1 Tax=Longimicrobium sp. TaxID=2029185 RepID=UPI002E303AD3|nr:hypothetical protein [Longimicrobium sp.]HEX6042638.1 hypothetical protein [Longimicrobium sp.]
MASSRRGPFRNLDFEAAEQEQLRQAELPDDVAVWEAAGTRPEEPLAHLEAESGIGRARLRTVLADAGLREVGSTRGGVVSRHWLDAVLVGAVVLVSWLALREPAHPSRSRHVRTREAIVAYQVLDASQLADTTAPAPTGAIASIPTAAGRIVLRTIPKGQAVRKDDLGPRLAAGAMDGRAVMMITVAPTDAQPRPGTHVGLMFTPRTPGSTGAVLPDALVLAATRADSALNLLVALRQADLATAAALLGNAEVHVVATPP